MARALIEETVCPSCGGRGLEYTAEPVPLPFLGESLETMLRCGACGYRHNDFILTTSHEPTRHSYRVTRAEDMSVRVVRSGSGTLRIPELGVCIEPGIASEAFVSNVEGVILRIGRVLDQLLRDAEDEGARRRAESLAATLEDIRAGRGPPVTLVLEDPFGNSSIPAEGARMEAIPPEEAQRLKSGMTVLDPEGRLQGPP